MIVGPSSKYVRFAAQGLSVAQVVALTGCHRSTAKDGLERGRAELQRRRDSVAEAADLLERSGLATAALKGGASGERLVSKHRWEEIALGGDLESLTADALGLFAA